MIDIAVVKARASLADLMRRDGHQLRGAEPEHTCRCPFHEERTASFRIFSDGHFHCYGCGEHGDVLDYFQRTRNVTLPEAVQALAGEVGPISPTIHCRQVSRPQPAPPERQWPAVRPGTDREIQILAKLRGLDTRALIIAQEKGWLRFAKWKGEPAWFVTDSTGQSMQGRRLDGRPWDEIQAKAWTMKGSRAAWPIGLRDTGPADRIMLVEGAPDFLAALHFMVLRGETGVAPVAMLGSSLRIPDDALPIFAGKHVRIYRHEDAAGRKAAKGWAKQLVKIGCRGEHFKFKRLRQVSGEPVKDLNDAARISERDAAELENLLP